MSDTELWVRDVVLSVLAELSLGIGGGACLGPRKGAIGGNVIGGRVESSCVVARALAKLILLL